MRRPHAGPKTKSKLRISFNPGVEGSNEDSSSDAVQNAPPKATRIGASAISRSSALQRDEGDRPSYSKSYLDELKGSTPSTPKDLSLYNSSAEDELPAATSSLDIASKFGAATNKPSAAIPSAAEIAEKKARRLRLAREHEAAAATSGSVKNNDDFVSLDAYDSDGEFKPSRLQVSNYLRNDRADDAQEYTRLVPEDEDIAEGFEQFVEDDHAQQQKTGRILMGMKPNTDQERERMREMIDAAEGASASDESDADSDSDASAEQNYVTAQTAHGTAFSNLSASQRRKIEKETRRPKQPDKTTPVPTLAAGLSRLRELKEQAEMNRTRAENRKAEIRRRLAEIDSEKGRIQGALADLGEQLEAAERKVQAEKESEGLNGGAEVRQGGLDDIGARAQS